MNGIYLYFVNKHLSSWALLGLNAFSAKFNSLPNDKILDWSKLKAFLSLIGLKKIVGKGENAGYQHFLLSLKIFKRLFT